MFRLALFLLTRPISHVINEMERAMLDVIIKSMKILHNTITGHKIMRNIKNNFCLKSVMRILIIKHYNTSFFLISRQVYFGGTAYNGTKHRCHKFDIYVYDLLLVCDSRWLSKHLSGKVSFRNCDFICLS